MLRIIFSKKGALARKDIPSSSEFSDFFRKAPAGEKKRVFLKVAKKATERQRAYMQ